MKKMIVLVVVVGVLASGGTAAYKMGKIPPSVSYAVNNIIARFQPPVDEYGIAVSGNVEITEVNIGFTLAGRIQELLVEEGQAVNSGDVLARLENIELATLVTQNQAMLDEALVRLDELKTGSRSQQIQQANAAVAVVVAEMSKAQKDYERAQALYKEKLIPVSQLDAAKSAYNAVKARHQQAVEQLSLVKEGATKESIRVAELKVEQARAAVLIAEERLKNSTLLAPLSGIILRKNAEVGEIIAQGTPLYTIGDLQNPWIKVYVSQDKLGLVKLGQRAEISIDSFPDKVYSGAITYIASQAEFTPKTVQTKEERVKLVFAVKVKAQNVNDELKPGMPADVRLVLN